MVEIVLTESHSGYEAVAEYIRRYWKHNVCDAVICSIATSHDGKILKCATKSPRLMDLMELSFCMIGGRVKNTSSFLELRGCQKLI